MSLQKNGFPEDAALKEFTHGRHRVGATWRFIFQVSTVISIIALLTLLYNIGIGVAGYVVVQNKINPSTLLLQVEKNRLLDAAEVVASEKDEDLVKGVASDPNGIGFFGYAYYKANLTKLNALTIDGIAATSENVANKQYPLARPLFIYTTDKILQDKPHVATFTNYYLTYVNEMVEQVGYFPLDEATFMANTPKWFAATGTTGTTLPVVIPAEVEANSAIHVVGSSTVYPLSRQLAIQFRKDGYAGDLKLDNIGSGAGFKAFCKRNGPEIVNASRPINRTEIDACNKAQVGQLIEFPVASDGLVVVVNPKNQFLKNVTLAELRQIFTTAQTWSEVNPAWPNEPIVHYIPGNVSGTLDFFAETVFKRELKDLPAETLVAILEQNLSSGLIKRLNSEQPLTKRTQAELYELVTTRVLEPRIVKSWNLVQSLFNQAEINAFVPTIPNGELQWHTWFTWNFLTSPQSSVPELAGVRTALFGSILIILITISLALPFGIGAAIYLEEYATNTSNPMLLRINTVIQTNINNLAGVPSIIYGMLGLSIFVRFLEPLTSGTMFGLADPTTSNGRTIMSAALTLALLVLPLIIINAQEAIRAVPNSLRQAGMGLGATKWQTIWHHVIPAAIPGILTGNILAIARALGETAPLVVIGASTFITVDPNSPFSKFTTLPIQIYQWTARPEDEFRNIAAAAIVVLMVLLLTLNASAILLRNRFSRRAS